MYRILIIEDDRTIANVLAEHLRTWDYEVHCVTNFKNVMEDFREYEPQLVLLDIVLPLFNGFHWCQEIRKISKVPIIFLSSANDNMNIVMAMNMGGDEFVEKPFDLSVVTAKVQAVLRRAYAFRGTMDVLEHAGVMLNVNDATVTCDTEDARTYELLQDMQTELFKTEQYVEMVLTYVRMEDMSGDLMLKEYALDNLVKQALKKYSRMFAMQKLALHYEALRVTVTTDEKWLVFVLEQILSNALKYTVEGSISIYMEDDWLVIEDTGIGICSEDLPRIFEKGFTGYNGRSDKKSTGIGLYLCKQIIEKLRCQIRVESKLGKGTRVLLYLMKENLQVE